MSSQYSSVWRILFIFISKKKPDNFEDKRQIVLLFGNNLKKTSQCESISIRRLQQYWGRGSRPAYGLNFRCEMIIRKINKSLEVCNDNEVQEFLTIRLSHLKRIEGNGLGGLLNIKTGEQRNLNLSKARDTVYSLSINFIVIKWNLRQDKITNNFKQVVCIFMDKFMQENPEKIIYLPTIDFDELSLLGEGKGWLS